MMTDPVADMLTRIRNAGCAGHAEVRCRASKLKRAIAEVMVAEGYLDAVAQEEREGRPVLCIKLRYNSAGDWIVDGLQRVSRPSRRVYVGAGQVPKVRNGLGIAVLSTPRGVVSDRRAREENVGGEVLCEVW